ncbi:unnamed protein product [Clonostachys byssicola]|uniref:Uncharacterized protein n=1 Tax=Clonostachys byssicola TaxID=160290 RepID=A0A9N9U7F8_9HYPO|nr:unnamed protein product [Clonostachys byssicola]
MPYAFVQYTDDSAQDQAVNATAPDSSSNSVDLPSSGSMKTRKCPEINDERRCTYVQHKERELSKALPLHARSTSPTPARREALSMLPAITSSSPE